MEQIRPSPSQMLRIQLNECSSTLHKVAQTDSQCPTNHSINSSNPPCQLPSDFNQPIPTPSKHPTEQRKRESIKKLETSRYQLLTTATEIQERAIKGNTKKYLPKTDGQSTKKTENTYLYISLMPSYCNFRFHLGITTTIPLTPLPHPHNTSHYISPTDFPSYTMNFFNNYKDLFGIPDVRILYPQNVPIPTAKLSINNSLFANRPLGSYEPMPFIPKPK
jgi:hypothetical protein